MYFPFIANRFRVAVHLFSNRPQVTSWGHGRRKKLVCEVQLRVSLQDDPATFGCHLWFITEQMHCNMNSVWIWKFPSSITFVLSKSLYSMVVTTQVSCKATSKNIKKSPHIFQDQHIRIKKLCRGFTCAIRFHMWLIYWKKHHPF